MELTSRSLTIVEETNALYALPFVQALINANRKKVSGVYILSDGCRRPADWSYVNDAILVDVLEALSESPFDSWTIFNFLKTKLENAGKTIVLIDCFESLLLHCGFHALVRLLNNLREEFEHYAWLVAVSVRYLCDDRLEQLRMVATNIYRLETDVEDGSVYANEVHDWCVKSTWQFKIDKDNNFELLKRHLKGKGRKESSTLPTRSSDGVEEVISSATFKLALNKDEWEAKSNLRPPYMGKTNAAPKSIRIHYLAEAEDDLDDEDPDDDLDL